MEDVLDLLIYKKKEKRRNMGRGDERVDEVDRGETRGNNEIFDSKKFQHWTTEAG
jgi:hypothetical protein